MATKKQNNELFSALLYVVLGVLLIIFRAQALGWAMTVAGIVFIIAGALELVKQNWTSGAVSLAVGIAIIVLGWLAAAIVLLVLGILIAVKGAVSLINILKKSQKNVMEIVFAALTVILGLALAFGNGLEVILIVVGVLLAVDGVLGVIGALKK